MVYSEKAIILIAILFSRDIKTIGKHINNALKEELKDEAVVAKFATTAADGKTYQVEFYNLDMILSVGYRVKSQQGVRFRKWANKVLKEYLLNGYVVNARIVAQYPPIKVEPFNKAHDRFLLIDDEVYHIGASIKDLGRKWFAFTCLKDIQAAEMVQRIQ